MDMDLTEQALAYLREDAPLHITMLDPIARGSAEICAASRFGVLMREKEGGAWMLSAASAAHGEALMDLLPPLRSLVVFQDFLVSPAQKRFSLGESLPCYSAVYLKKEKIPYAPRLSVRHSTEAELPRIKETYHMTSPAGIDRAHEKGDLYCGFDGDLFVGFAGRHAGGSLGMLEIFPDCRQKGYGAELESFLVNKTLDAGCVPYVHVVVGNEKSWNLQKKLGFTFAESLVYWL